jgi:endonuclease/exonuclease/phosphatase (EEP) superfamily protein YafD
MAGCIRVPDQNWTISHRPPLETRRQVDDCSAACLTPSPSSPVAAQSSTSGQPNLSATINSDGFSLVSWNMFKGRKRGWDEDFTRLSQNTDILVLQEAYLSPSLKHLLHHHVYHWDMTTAFEYREIEAGVLTASRIRPNFTCTFLEKEPVTRIPKGVLITRYAMSRTHQQLLVANIHAINFTTKHSAFEKQNDRLETLLNAHPGPMIVAGDFNTWSKGRMSRVKAMTDRLGLTAVKFDDNRTRIFGQSIDHVYYRGLESTYALTSMTTASDHNPLTVGFKRVDENETPEA